MANAIAFILAKLLRQGCNVLLLDEPTNDLDVDTLRALEEAIANFAGCVVVTSHDRWFLDRLATHILAFEGDGKLTWCEGNFEIYERNLRERLGEDSDTVSKRMTLQEHPLQLMPTEIGSTVFTLADCRVCRHAIRTVFRGKI